MIWTFYSAYTKFKSIAFFPMLSQIFGCVKTWLVGRRVCAWHAGEGWGKGGQLRNIWLQTTFLLSLSSRIAGAVNLEHPPRASLNYIQLQWPLMGIVHHSGQQHQHRSQPQFQNTWAVSWIMAVPSGCRYYYFSKHIAECCAIVIKT